MAQIVYFAMRCSPTMINYLTFILYSCQVCEMFTPCTLPPYGECIRAANGHTDIVNVNKHCKIMRCQIQLEINSVTRKMIMYLFVLLAMRQPIYFGIPLWQAVQSIMLAYDTETAVNYGTLV